MRRQDLFQPPACMLCCCCCGCCSATAALGGCCERVAIVAERLGRGGRAAKSSSKSPLRSCVKPMGGASAPDAPAAAVVAARDFCLQRQRQIAVHHCRGYQGCREFVPDLCLAQGKTAFLATRPALHPVGNTQLGSDLHAMAAKASRDRACTSNSATPCATRCAHLVDANRAHW